MKTGIWAILAVILITPALAIVSHTPGQITPGAFQNGNYFFNGSIGIGTTNPTTTFQIVSSSNNAMSVKHTTTDGTPIIYIGNSDFSHYGLMAVYGGVSLPFSGALSGATTFGAASNDALQLAANNGVKMTILPNGNVGIGTSSPGSKLEVYDGNVYINTAGRGQLVLNNRAANTAWGQVIQTDGRMDFSYGANGAQDPDARTATLTLKAGNVGIGATSPGFKLEVNGNTGTSGYYYWTGTDTVSGSGLCYGWTGSHNYMMRCASSSQRYKENISDMTLGLDDVMRLRPVTFDYKKGYTINDSGRQAGFIAEEVGQVSPMFINYLDGSPEDVKYDRLVALNTKAIQELKAQNDAKTVEIGLLKSELCKKDTSYSWC